MNPYYTANTIFVVLSMMIMLTAVSFNTTLDQQRKNITRVLFPVISTAALCECWAMRWTAPRQNLSGCISW